MRCIQCILVLRRRGRVKYYLIFVLEVTVVREQVENQVYRNLMPLVPALLLVADASFFIIGLVLLAFMVGNSAPFFVVSTLTSPNRTRPHRHCRQHPYFLVVAVPIVGVSFIATLMSCCRCTHARADPFVIIVSFHWRPNVQKTARWRKAGLCSNEKRVGMSGHLPGGHCLLTLPH